MNLRRKPSYIHYNESAPDLTLPGFATMACSAWLAAREPPRRFADALLSFLR